MSAATLRARLRAEQSRREGYELAQRAIHAAQTARQEALEVEGIPAYLRTVLEADDEMLTEISLALRPSPELIYYEKGGKWGNPYVPKDDRHEGGHLTYREDGHVVEWFALLTSKGWRISGKLTAVERWIVRWELPPAPKATEAEEAP